MYNNAKTNRQTSIETSILLTNARTAFNRRDVLPQVLPPSPVSMLTTNVRGPSTICSKLTQWRAAFCDFTWKSSYRIGIKNWRCQVHKSTTDLRNIFPNTSVTKNGRRVFRYGTKFGIFLRSVHYRKILTRTVQKYVQKIFASTKQKIFPTYSTLRYRYCILGVRCRYYLCTHMYGPGLVEPTLWSISSVSSTYSRNIFHQHIHFTVLSFISWVGN